MRTTNGHVCAKRMNLRSTRTVTNEGNFGVQEGALHFADARAPYDLHEFYDFKLTLRGYQTISAPKDANFFLHDKRKATDPDDDGKDK
jgi:hypothetical protein